MYLFNFDCITLVHEYDCTNYFLKEFKLILLKEKWNKFYLGLFIMVLRNPNGIKKVKKGVFF